MLSAFSKNFLKTVIFALIFTGFLCHSPAVAEDTIKIGGVGGALGTMRLLVDAFERSHPGVKVVVLPTMGSSGAIKAVSQGVIDIGLVGRPMKEQERKLGLKTIEYAKTPLAFVTKMGIKKSNVSTVELIRILNGEMTTWPDGQRLRLILRPADDSETLLVKTMSEEIGKAMDAALARPGMIKALTSQESADMLEKTPGAFGFSALTLIISEKRSLNVLSYNNVIPSVKSLADGSYPLYELLYMVTRPETSPQIRLFVDFVRSAEGRGILEKSGNSAISR